MVKQKSRWCTATFLFVRGCYWFYYLPMQHIYTIDWKRFSLLIGTTRIFTMTRKILTNSSCWKSAISIYVLYRAFQAHFQVSVDAKFKWFIFSLLPHLRSKWFLMQRYAFLAIILNVYRWKLHKCVNLVLSFVWVL